MKTEQDKEKTSLNYSVNFYALVQQIIIYYSDYEELLLEAKTIKEEKEQEQDYATIEEEQITLIKNYNTALRKTINQAQIHYETVKKQEKEDEITKLYTELKKDYMLDVEKVKKYAIALNKYVMTKLSPEGMENNELRSIYKTK